MYCKPFYVGNLLRELNANGTYEHAPDLSTASLTTQHRTLLKTLKIPFVAADFNVVAYFYNSLKAHKDPIGHRYIAASHKTPIAPLSIHLNHALDALRDPIDQLWNDTLATGNLPSSSSWILHKPDTLLDTLKLANQSLRASNEADEMIEDEILCTYDFSTLYTLIPHSAIKSRLRALFVKVFTQQATRKGGRYTLLAVSSTGAKWVKADHPRKRDTLYHTASTLSDFLDTLIDNCYDCFVIESTGKSSVSPWEPIVPSSSPTTSSSPLN